VAVGYFLDVHLGSDQWGFLSNIDSKVILAAMANNILDKNFQYRNKYTGLGYQIGQNPGIINDDLYYDKIWTDSIESQLSNWDGKDESLIANQIWDVVFASPRNNIQPSEGTINNKGGYVFWSQDLEFNIGSGITPEDMKDQFSGMISLLWAGRKILGKGFKIIPVVSNSIQRNWDGKNDYVDIAELINTDLQKLNLQKLPARTDGRSWNLMSFLRESKLIDGFIGEGYSPANIGQLDHNSAPFVPHQNIPYAVMGSWEKNLKNASTPIQSDYWGSLPANAAAYFSDESAASNFKSSSFQPVKKNLFAYNASALQVQNDVQIVDLSDLSADERSLVKVNLSRDANYTVQAGFYSVANVQGSVFDPITGELVSPGDDTYERAAMSSENIISQLNDLSLSENGVLNDDQVHELSRGMIAPYVRILEPGLERTYFSFSEANPDKMNHFAQLSPNSFGIEDTLGGGDLDYNDLTVSLEFLDVVAAG